MKTFLALLVLGCSLATAQKTMQLKDGQTSPSVSLSDVEWISGHWQGKAFGGIAEEIWSPPLGNSMMFVFKLVNDGKISFYEIGHIQEVDATLILQLKHFHGNLKGWEEKDDTVDFKLVKLETNKVFFEGMTFEKITDDHIRIYVLIEEDEKADEVLFDYYRVKT